MKGSGLSSLYGVRLRCVQGSGWRVSGGLPAPLRVLSAGGRAVPCFCSWLFRSGSSGRFVQNLPLMRSYLVPCGFFAFCCWRRGESRCKHQGKGFQEPACLGTSAWPSSSLMLSAREQPSSEDRKNDAPTSLGPLEQILHSDKNHLDKQAPLSSLELP